MDSSQQVLLGGLRQVWVRTSFEHAFSPMTSTVNRRLEAGLSNFFCFHSLRHAFRSYSCSRSCQALLNANKDNVMTVGSESMYQPTCRRWPPTLPAGHNNERMRPE